MIKILLRAILIINLTPSLMFAEGVLPDNYLAYSILINTSNGSSGSGFILGNDTNQFLITAKHVLLDTNCTLTADSADVIYYSRVGTNTPVRCNLTIDLKGLYGVGDIRCHPSQDVVAVRLAVFTDVTNNVTRLSPFCKSNGSAGFSMAKLNLLKLYKDVQVSNDVYLFGFPNSIGSKLLLLFAVSKSRTELS
jgi:hypothetical protein